MLERDHQIYVLRYLSEASQLLIDQLQLHGGIFARAVVFDQEVSHGGDGLLILHVEAEEVEDHACEDVADVCGVVQRQTRLHYVGREFSASHKDPVSALDGLLIVAFVYLDVVLDEEVDRAQRFFELHQVLRVVVKTILTAG